MATASKSDAVGTESAIHHQDDVDNLKPINAVREVQGDAHFHETVTAAPLDPWSKASIQLYLILLVAALNATTSGFDGVSLAPLSPCIGNLFYGLHFLQSIFSSINAMQQYEDYFHHEELGSTTGM